VVVVFNKADRQAPDGALEQKGSVQKNARWSRLRLRKQGLDEIRHALLEAAPADFINNPAILGRPCGPGEMAVLVVPIDKEAPKGAPDFAAGAGHPGSTRSQLRFAWWSRKGNCQPRWPAQRFPAVGGDRFPGFSRSGGGHAGIHTDDWLFDFDVAVQRRSCGPGQRRDGH
jgi:hypothetical protein